MSKIINQLLLRINRLPIWRVPVNLGAVSFVPPTADRLLALLLYRSRLLRTDEIIQNLVQPGMNVADIGANQGLYTMLFSRLVGSGTVHAFEPDPLLFQTLRSNLARNGTRNVRLYPFALASDNQNRYLHRGTLNSGDNRLSKKFGGSDEQVLVEVRTLDKLLGQVKLDLLKIDTQGFELEVLKGGSKVLGSNKNLIVICEFWPYGLKMNGTEPRSVLDLLRQHGFHIIHRVGNGWQEFGDNQVRMIKGRKYLDLVAGRFLV